MAAAFVRRDNFSRSLSSLSDRTALRQINPSLVRRLRRGLGDVSCLLSNRASSRLSLRRRHDPSPRTETPIRPPLGAYAGQSLVAADRAANILALARANRSGLAHSRATHVFDWPPVRPAERHKPAAANVVRALLFRAFAISSICAFQPCFPARVAELSLSDRAAVFFSPTIHPLVVRLWAFRHL